MWSGLDSRYGVALLDQQRFAESEAILVQASELPAEVSSWQCTLSLQASAEYMAPSSVADVIAKGEGRGMSRTIFDHEPSSNFWLCFSFWCWHHLLHPPPVTTNKLHCRTTS